MEQRKGDWSQTFTAKKVFPIDPRPEEIDILDIAHSLSLQCRFNGMCEFFYSVAEHSVRVADLVKTKTTDKKVLLVALLHDAQESYTCDIPRPLKRFLPGYKEIEEKMAKVIMEKYGILKEYEESLIKEIIKWADNTLLMTEARDLMKMPPSDWSIKEEPLKEKIITYSDIEAEKIFLEYFNELYR